MASTERQENQRGLTPEQRAIVESGDGPLVVIAGAGTGKTRVIVERVRWLLDTKADLLPEQLLVLTYNVKAARELRERVQQAVGAATAARLTISNFHSFCHRVLSESAAEADMPRNPDVLDGIGQLLLLKELRPELQLIYHNTNWHLAEFVKFINRAQDELVSPDDFDAFVATERATFEDRYGRYTDALSRLVINGNLAPVRAVRKEYAKSRAGERAGEEPGRELEKTADREARRTISGTGRALYRNQFPDERHAKIDELADTYVHRRCRARGDAAESFAILDAIRQRLGTEPNWSDAAVPHRKHKHREPGQCGLRSA